jgi:hypothetical protein
LSRCESGLLGAISVCSTSWQEKIVATYHDNEEDKQLLIALSLPTPHPGGFSLFDALIRYMLAQQHVLQALHSGI